MTLLRAELLAGQAIAVGGSATDGLSTALRELGARVEAVAPDLPEEDETVGRWAGEHAPLQAVVFDARPSFGAGGAEALTQTVHRAWVAVREVAVGALIEGSDPGKVVLIAPPPDAGPHARAVAAALENLVRTLSIEWARYRVTTVVVVPEAGTDESELTELLAFLCSSAGQYLSGCRLALGASQEGVDSAQGTTTASS